MLLLFAKHFDWYIPWSSSGLIGSSIRKGSLVQVSSLEDNAKTISNRYVFLYRVCFHTFLQYSILIPFFLSRKRSHKNLNLLLVWHAFLQHFDVCCVCSFINFPKVFLVYNFDVIPESVVFIHLSLFRYDLLCLNFLVYFLLWLFYAFQVWHWENDLHHSSNFIQVVTEIPLTF